MADLALDATRRAQTWRRLAVRNGVVAVLRLVVPVLGALVFAVLSAQIVLSQLAERFGIAGASIDRGTLIVDAPRYAGVLPSGSAYAMAAEEARLALADPTVISLGGVAVSLTEAGRRLEAIAADATVYTLAQRIVVPGALEVSDGAGLSGTLQEVDIDFFGQQLTAEHATLTLPDGSRLTAEGGVFYDAAVKLWTFTGVHMIIPSPATVPSPAATVP